MDLTKMIGKICKDDDPFTRKMRIHQGWWRAFALGEDEGTINGPGSGTVCNRINDGENSGKNFISIKGPHKKDGALDVVRKTVSSRTQYSPGIIDEKRLYNNLLSSQPLCFNFFGELKNDKVLAAKILRLFIPSITSVEEVYFEYVPSGAGISDNSAFDVAFELLIEGSRTLFAMECKYTDTFSETVYTKINKNKYLPIFEDSNRFKNKYEDYSTSEYDQLFRNELIASKIIEGTTFKRVITGLFYHRDDRETARIGDNFSSMLNDSSSIFKMITYQHFIEQALTLTDKDEVYWEHKEWLMTLWARYCALGLSEEVFKQYDK